MARFLYSGRTEQHKAALRREADALVLKESRHWRGAMYLLGYAVECRLKAQLMEKYRADTLEELADMLNRRIRRELDLFNHNLELLFDLLDVRDKLIGRDGDQKNLRAFHRCSRWRVDWRYRPDEGNELECRLFFDAVKQFLSFVQQNG